MDRINQLKSQLKLYKRNVKLFLGRIVNRLVSDLSWSDRFLIDRIQARKITYLSRSKLESIIDACESADNLNLPGIFIEAGCALGGSACLISRKKTKSRPFLIYDVFGQIPPPSSKDPQDVHDRYRTILEGASVGIDGDRYYGYEINLYEIVQLNLRSFGVHPEENNIKMIQGMIQDTMFISDPVSFAHIDVDWYDPVMVCLQRIVPNLVIGGSIVIDDYNDWGGCRMAVDEYFESVSGDFAFCDTAGSLKITRVNLVENPASL